jgi:hypothetical protein
MTQLHESIASSFKETTIKESNRFRLRMEKWEVLSPKGLYSVNLINEVISDSGEIVDSSTYNYFMTKEELQTLAHGLTL